jgi:hypothetical protein
MSFLWLIVKYSIKNMEKEGQQNENKKFSTPQPPAILDWYSAILRSH